MDPMILRMRFSEVLEEYDMTPEDIEEIVEQLVPITEKLSMSELFEIDDDEEEPDDDLDTG